MANAQRKLTSLPAARHDLLIITDTSLISRRATAATLLLTAGFVLSGCMAPDQLDTTYGTRSRAGSAQSVNGTHVLAEMFREAGFRVSASPRLGRAVEQADVVIWFPNRFRPPDEEVRLYFESWLRDRSGRALVYVARDFDASIVYWEQVLTSAAPDQVCEVRRRLARCKAAHAQARSGFDEHEDCDWFALRRDLAPRRATTLAGPWSAGIDASRADIRIFTRLEASAETSRDRADDDEAWFGSDDWTELLTSDEDIAGRAIHASDVGAKQADHRYQWVLATERHAGKSRAPQAGGTFDCRVRPARPRRFSGNGAR